MASEDIRFEVASRATYRTSITKTYNNRHHFCNYDEVKLTITKNKLPTMSKNLPKLDLSIAKLKFIGDSDPTKFQKERDDSEIYQDRINDCLHKSSVAHDDTTLELLVKNFEATISNYNYTAYDEFLLLRQQVKGKVLYLI